MVLAAADVQRWVQPDLIERKVAGEAFVAFAGSAATEVAGVAPANVVLAVGYLAGAAVDGFATVALAAVDSLSPMLDASAVVNVVADGLTDDYHAAAAIALVPISGLSFDQVALDGSVLFEVMDSSVSAVEVTGDAEVSFGDFGMDVPLFPMTFPFQFTDRSLLRFGDALLAVGGLGVMDAVAVDGVAEVGIAGKARLNFQGSIPVFPFGFPAVFDNEANVRLGTALVVPGEQPAVSAVAVDADALVPIYGASNALHQTIFGFAFPAIFDSSGYARADAVLSVVSDCSTAVVLGADAVVGVSAFMSVGSSAVFPWTFGVIFE